MKAIGIATATLMLVVVTICFGGETKSEASAPAAPVRIYPVVDPSYGFLLGGTSQGKWLTTDVMSDTVVGGETYRVYGLKGYLGRAVGSGAPSAGEPCEETRVVDLKPSYQDNKALAVGGT